MHKCTHTHADTHKQTHMHTQTHRIAHLKTVMSTTSPLKSLPNIETLYTFLLELSSKSVSGGETSVHHLLPKSLMVKFLLLFKSSLGDLKENVWPALGRS